MPLGRYLRKIVECFKPQLSFQLFGLASDTAFPPRRSFSIALRLSEPIPLRKDPGKKNEKERSSTSDRQTEIIFRSRSPASIVRSTWSASAAFKISVLRDFDLLPSITSEEIVDYFTSKESLATKTDQTTSSAVNPSLLTVMRRSDAAGCLMQSRRFP